MRRGRYLRALALSAAAVIALVGCGKKKEQAPQTAPAEVAAPAAQVEMTGMKVGISLPDETVQRWADDGTALQTMFRQKGYDAEVIYAAGSPEQQVRDVKSLAGSSCNLLIIAAVDGGNLSAAMETVRESGIPVIAYDRLIEKTDVVTEYVAFDDYKVGELEAHFILDSLGLKDAGTSKVHHMEFAAGDKSDKRQGYYFNGAYDTLKPFLDSGALQISSGQYTFSEAVSAPKPLQEGEKPEKAETVSSVSENRMKGILSESYSGANTLDAVLCTDDAAAAGVMKALKSGYSGKNEVYVTGFGATEENRQSLLDGQQSMSVFAQPEKLRAITVDLAVSLMKGESPDETLIERGGYGDFCRYDTESYDTGMGVIASYLVEPVVMTKANAEKLLGTAKS